MVYLNLTKMDKQNVYRDLLMLYIKDNYQVKNNESITTHQAIDIENKIGMFLKTQLGSRGKPIYTMWYSAYYGCHHKELNEQVYDDIKTDKSITSDYLMRLARPFDLDNSTVLYKTEEDILDEKYKELKEVFEENYFKCSDNYVKVCGNSLSPFNKSSFCTIHEDLYYDDSNQHLFLPRWLKDPTKRCYDRIDFLPNGNEPGVFNTWDIVRREDHVLTALADTKDLHELVLKVCGNEHENYEYFMKYLAHLIQFPERKPEVCIFFTSAQGSGKDTLINLIKLLSGEACVAFENDPDRIFGKFNMNSRQNKLVVCLQEADNIKSYSGKIKDLITCQQTTLEQKNVRSFSIKDYTRLFILSNNENIIKIEPDDRRFVVFKSWNFRFAPDPEFFKRVYKCMDDPNCVQTFLEELRNIPVEKNYNFQQHRPQTEIYQNLKELNTPAIIKWAYTLIDTDTDKMSTTNLCDSYNDYCNMTYESSTRVSPKSFGHSLRKYFYINNNWTGFEKQRSNQSKGFHIKKEALKNIIENIYNYTEEL